MQGPGQRARPPLTCDSQEELTDVGLDYFVQGTAASKNCPGTLAHLTQKSAAHGHPCPRGWGADALDDTLLPLTDPPDPLLEPK